MSDLNDLSFGQAESPDHPNGANKGSSSALAINQSGQVVGESDSSIGVSNAEWNWQVASDVKHPVSFSIGAVPQDLNLASTSAVYVVSEARSVNDLGAIVGWGARDGYSAFFAYGAAVRFLDPVPDQYGASWDILANGINNLNHVVGSLGATNSAFIWVPTSDLPESEPKVIDLENVSLAAGFRWTQAAAINDRDQIVGSGYFASSGRSEAVLWQNGKLHRLNDLIGPHPAFTLESATAISQNGMIAANSPNDFGQAFLLIPFQLKQSNYPTTKDTTDLGPVKEKLIDAKTEAYITGLPEMPKLSATILSGALSGLDVEWRLEVKSERPERETKDDHRIPQTDETDVVTLPITQPWNLYDYFIAPADFFGGNCSVFYRIKGPTGYIDSERSLQFQIRGKNPKDADARSHIESTQGVYRFAWAMVQHESREPRTNRVYNQFNSTGPSKNLPFFSGNYPVEDGWGMAQLDKPFGISASTAEVYSWQTNVQTFIRELGQKRSFAISYFNALKNIYQAKGKWEEPPEYTPDGTETAMSALEAATIQLYNGAAWLVEIQNGAIVYDGRYTNTSHGGTRYISCWKFHPNKPVGQKWEFKPNQNNYVYKVVYDEYEPGHSPIVE